MADMSSNKFWDIVWSRKYERYNRHHKEIWEKVLPYLSGEVLDIGCGAAVMYEGKELSLTGVDFSEGALAQAKLHYPKGNYVLADARNTGLPSGKFDVVIMLGLLDYFDDWTPVIEEARRVMKKDGKIIATLLQGFANHDWSEANVKSKYPVKRYEKVCGNWMLIEI